MVHICDMVRYLIELSAINLVQSQFSPPKGQFQCAYYEIIDSSPGVSIITDDWRNTLATLLRGVSYLFPLNWKLEIKYIILLREKFLQYDWLRAVEFQLNLKYLHVKITKLLRVVV